MSVRIQRLCGCTAAVVDLKWLGLHGKDVDTFGISQECLLPLSKTDSRKLSSMLEHPFVKVLCEASHAHPIKLHTYSNY